jgi:late competence protein required for DNA uptake (superfamily II DNA/RNA helicase)
MSIINQKETSTLIKEGIKPCNRCEWVDDEPIQTSQDITKYKRICVKCGRVENITIEVTRGTYQDVYNKFHKE